MKRKNILLIILTILLISIIILTIIYNIPKYSTLIKIDNKLGKNIYKTIIKSDEIYSLKKHQKIKKEIKKLYTLKNNLNNPLIIYNPYGTNQLSLNIYFYTLKNTTITYEIKVKDCPNFKQTAYEENKKNHQIQIIGLVAGKSNTVKITSTDKNNHKKVYTFVVNLPKMHTPKINIEKENNNKELINGLYAFLGSVDEKNHIDDIYLADNNGIIRAKFPLIHIPLLLENDTTDNIIFYDNCIFYNVSYNNIIKVNRLGEIVDSYKWKNYSKHHDFVIDKKNNKMIILASNLNDQTMEDIILIYDLEKKKITNTIDLKTLLPEIYEKSNKVTTYYSKDKIDWIHLNSIDLIEDEIIVSSRELSSIINIDNIYIKPKIKYILGLKEIFQDTQYENLVYNKDEDFKIHLGQHTASFYKSKKNYITLFDNNYASSQTINWIDWKSFNNKKISNYYLYKVDENKKNYSLKEKIEIPFSGYMSSSQILQENIIISSREPHYYAEFNNKRNLIKEFKVNQYNYRIYKYTFKNFWFK